MDKEFTQKMFRFVNLANCVLHCKLAGEIALCVSKRPSLTNPMWELEGSGIGDKAWLGELIEGWCIGNPLFP